MKSKKKYFLHFLHFSSQKLQLSPPSIDNKKNPASPFADSYAGFRMLNK